MKLFDLIAQVSVVKTRNKTFEILRPPAGGGEGAIATRISKIYIQI